MTQVTQRLEEVDTIALDLDEIALDLPTDQEIWELDAIALYELENWLEGLQVEDWASAKG